MSFRYQKNDEWEACIHLLGEVFESGEVECVVLVLQCVENNNALRINGRYQYPSWLS